MFFILVGKSENDHEKGCRTLNPVRPILSVPWKLYEGLPRSPAAYLTWPEMSFNGVYGRSRYKFWFWQAGPKDWFIYRLVLLTWAFNSKLGSTCCLREDINRKKRFLSGIAGIRGGGLHMPGFFGPFFYQVLVLKIAFFYSNFTVIVCFF